MVQDPKPDSNMNAATHEPTEVEKKEKLARPSSEPLVGSVEPIERSRVPLFFQALVLVGLVDGAYFLFFFIFTLLAPTPLSLLAVVILLLGFVAKVSVTVYLMVEIIVVWASQTYVIAGHHLIVRRGVAETVEKIYELNDIRTITMHEGTLGKMLNYGDIILVIASSGVTEEVHLPAIGHVRKYEQIFEKYLDIEVH